MRFLNGILNHPVIRKHYEEKINTRPLCEDCWKARKDFEDLEKRHNKCYSTLGPGFSSETIDIPLDVLVIADSHGGGDKTGYVPQRTLEEELEGFKTYYMDAPLQTFHQKYTRTLLSELDRLEKSWVFTDLLKCFVSKGNRKRNGRNNFNTAISHCRIYLDEQINLFQPSYIIGFGKNVSTALGINDAKMKHGQSYQFGKSILITSYFPSQWNADRFIANGEWDSIIKHLFD